MRSSAIGRLQAEGTLATQNAQFAFERLESSRVQWREIMPGDKLREITKCLRFAGLGFVSAGGRAPLVQPKTEIQSIYLPRRKTGAGGAKSQFYCQTLNNRSIFSLLSLADLFGNLRRAVTIKSRARNSERVADFSDAIGTKLKIHECPL